MKLEDKMREFAETLTDREISEQLSDIFEWAKIYKTILEEEQRERKEVRAYRFRPEENESEDEYYEEPEDEPDLPGYDDVIMDYYEIEAVHRALDAMSEEEIVSNLTRLRGLSRDGFSEEEIARLEFDIDACESHLMKLRGQSDTGVVCPSCGSVLPAGAVFCTKCGTKL